MTLTRTLRATALVASLGWGYANAEGCQSTPGDCSNPNISASDVYTCTEGGKVTRIEIYWCNGDISIYDYKNGTFKHKIAEQQN